MTHIEPSGRLRERKLLPVHVAHLLKQSGTLGPGALAALLGQDRGCDSVNPGKARQARYS